MPIHVPGKRDRHGKIRGAKRSVVAVLSLTAMVDLFTVLVVFLLQNYNATGQVINIPKGVELPEAGAVKELKPANIVVISEDEGVKLNNVQVDTWAKVKSQKEWMIAPLKDEIAKVIEQGLKEKKSVAGRIKDAVSKIGDEKKEEELDEFLKITIQADKEAQFEMVKKVMYTVTEAGIVEINFAVMKDSSKGDGSGG